MTKKEAIKIIGNYGSDGSSVNVDFQSVQDAIDFIESHNGEIYSVSPTNEQGVCIECEELQNEDEVLMVRFTPFGNSAFYFNKNNQ